jgi:glutamate-1-semialdehyde 2,1-aminomutase
MVHRQDGRPSAELLERSRAVTPDGINSASRMLLMHDADGNPLCFDRADGAYLYSMEGEKFIDYVNAWGPIILGHCDDDVNDFVTDHLSNRDLVGLSTSILEVEAAEMVKERVPCADKVQFGTTGSEVVAHAIRLARGLMEGNKILKFEGHYHGWYDPVLMNYKSEAKDLHMPNPLTAGMPECTTDETVVVPFNDKPTLAETLDEQSDEIAAIIMEPIAHNIGCLMPEEGFLQTVRTLCDEHDILLIFDEVVTGFRHCASGVQRRFGVTPDLTTMAKAVANGYPVSLLCGREDLMMTFSENRPEGHPAVYFAGTYNGNTPCMAAVVETLRQIDERNVHDRLDEIRGQIVPALEDHIEDTGVKAYVQEFGGTFATYFGDGPPSNWADILADDSETFLEYRWEMVDRGVLMPPRYPRSNLLNASLSDADIEQTIEAAGEAMREVA